MRKEEAEESQTLYCNIILGTERKGWLQMEGGARSSKTRLLSLHDDETEKIAHFKAYVEKNEVLKSLKLDEMYSELPQGF